MKPLVKAVVGERLSESISLGSNTLNDAPIAWPEKVERIGFQLTGTAADVK